MATVTNGSTGATRSQPKTIRFVNNQGQPPQKRRRINAACLTCRRRKTRCAGEQPTCSTCAKNGHTCLGYSDTLDKKSSTDHDEGECLDEEQEEDKRHWRPSSKNGVKPQDTEGTAISSRRLSEPGRPALSSVRPKTENSEWEDRQTTGQSCPGKLNRKPTNPRGSSFSTEDGRSPSIRSPMQQHHIESHRVPYFRYFGPTAIVPGFKQMVVKVRDRRRSSMSATSPSSGASYPGFLNPVPAEHDSDHLDDIPVYDLHDPNPVHSIILDLVDTFFVHLGCNYPFLRRDKFPKLVKEKRVEPILVDAVCALAARFSDFPIFNRWNDGKFSKADNGHVFALRAKAATVDTFPCPSVAAVQACLLMAYEGFGADQDSALWMYLGLAIRMAVDLGLHKKDGVKYQGEKDPWYTRSYHRKPGEHDANPKPGDDEDTLSLEEQKELEQERIDTFWSVFILDRVISSGTGRPVTLRDDDFELELPKTSFDTDTGWPDPFPTLIQIIHLYGRASDVLNSVIEPKDLTQDRINRLVVMEHELNKLHQRQDPRLRFDANNFQQYVKIGQGTTFILLHFWFHALIIVLHQPTLLAPLIGIDQAHELAPHSRELSMSSAKTIADILAFANLVDARSFIGNPFTSQPIYIAACAFLVESVTNTTPPPEQTLEMPQARELKNGSAPDSKSLKRRFLLASVASQNYQSCYKALQYMYTYWGGVRYILTALDQKSEGTWDCETYTREEYESTKLSRHRGSIQRFVSKVEQHPSPTVPPLAWSLTGTTNSPNSSLTLLFQNPVGNNAVPIPTVTSPQQPLPPPASAPTPPGNMIYDPIRQSLPEATPMYPPAYPQPNTSALRHSISHSQPRRVSSASNQSKSLLRLDGMTPDDASNTPTTPDSKFQTPLASQPSSATLAPTSCTPSSQHSSGYETSNYPIGASPASTLADVNSAQTQTGSSGPSGSTPNATGYSYLGPTSQGMHFITFDNETDIGQHLTSFGSTDMMNWFGDYFPNDVLGLYDNPGSMGQ
ncbi:fungal-specific transcription factor domain-containing protein [Xylariales sp. AK1849]|nr:fungal-specific transcription factor domain-containing protein [Xylariales sp. AK1849]